MGAAFFHDHSKGGTLLATSPHMCKLVYSSFLSRLFVHLFSYQLRSCTFKLRASHFSNCKTLNDRQKLELAGSHRPTGPRAMQSSQKSIAEMKQSVEHDHFTYRPLDWERREIRLVQLSRELRVASNGKSIPFLRMHHASFDGENLPQYTALSYTWGTRRKGAVLIKYKKDLIKFKNMPALEVQVSTNLLDALCHFATLSDQTLDTFRRVFWIDQLCINQNDKDEKNHQVAMIVGPSE